MDFEGGAASRKQNRSLWWLGLAKMTLNRPCNKWKDKASGLYKG